MSQDALQATFWGLVSGSALILGAFIGYYRKVSSKTIGSIMPFGSGVLISALSFELMDDAYKKAGSISTASGFIAGALIYTIANYILSKKGAKHRKRSNNSQPTEQEDPGSGINWILRFQRLPWRNYFRYNSRGGRRHPCHDQQHP